MEREKKGLVSAVIVGAGKGTRMNMDINKQYIDVGGRPVLARTLEAFEACDAVDEIILVVNTQDIIFCKQALIDSFGFKKVKTIVAGGEERQDSVYNGLREVSEGCDIVLIHDGARPFVRQEDIERSIDAAAEHGAACVAVPVKDTIKIADTQGFVDSTPERSALWAVQTPQTFRYRLICSAYENTRKQQCKVTDDCMIVEAIGHKVKLVQGSYSNIKITTAEDLAVAEAIAQQMESE